jgi:tRNA (guanine-N7-)-methyltransferase
MVRKPLMGNEHMRSFGRVQGRKLGKEQLWYVENILPEISVCKEDAVNLSGLFESKYNKFAIEIGFGKGEHLAAYAKVNPDTAFIGCEPFINGVASLLKFVHQDKIPNIKILHGDARVFLRELPDNIIEEIIILFPDPWPKVRHHKKRIINNEMLQQICRVLKKNGIIEIATDHVEYGNWILEHLELCKLLNKLRVSNTPPEGWIKTKYQEKAEKQLRGAMFFKYSTK